MHPQQQQGMGPCKTGIMLGGMMGAGIGGSAGIILGGAGGFFSGYRGFALLKQSAKLVFSLVKSNTSQKDKQLPTGFVHKSLLFNLIGEFHWQFHVFVRRVRL